MINTFEIGINAQKWTDNLHFINPFALRWESGQFAANVAGYAGLLMEAFPPDKQGESIIPIKRPADVSRVSYTLLRQFYDRYPGAIYSPAVIARQDRNGYTIGVAATKDGAYCAGLVLKEQQGSVRFTSESVGDSSDAIIRAGPGEIYTGLLATQRGLYAADTLFTFIVFQTLSEAQDRFS
jgi:hypothetical protein